MWSNMQREDRIGRKTFPILCVLTVTCLTWKQCVSHCNSQQITIQSSKLWAKNYTEHKTVSAIPLVMLYLIHVQMIDLCNFMYCYPQSPVPHFHKSPITAQTLLKTWEITHMNTLHLVWLALLLWFELPAHLQMMLASSFSEQQEQITADPVNNLMQLQL